MKKQIFISVALWGKEYAANFIEFSLASQLSRGNIPAIHAFCDVTYQIITTHVDKSWMEHQSLIKKLAEYCVVRWDFIEELYPQNFVGGKIVGDKYSFVSALQNESLKSASHANILIFNYADFIWADGSIYNVIADFADDIDAVLTFCIRVKDREMMRALKKYTHDDGVIEVAPRPMVDISLRYQHAETRLNYWDYKAFTNIPTSLIWPVENEGVIIHAYHQTILALRVQPEDTLYHNGIITTSLDGYFSAVLAENSRIMCATNSDKVFAISLCGDMGSTRISLGHAKEISMRNCLRWSVSEGQRQLVLHPIELRRGYTHPEKWQEVKNTARAIIEALHAQTKFIPSVYASKYRINRSQPTNSGDSAVPFFSNIISILVVLRVKILQLMIKILISRNIVLNGNFEQSESLKHLSSDSARLPAKHWLGRFDSPVQGRYSLSDKVPNQKSFRSLMVEGAEGATHAYLAQKIDRAELTNIRQSGIMICSGYLRMEGNPDAVVSLHVIPDEDKDGVEARPRDINDAVEIEQNNSWQYFEFCLDEGEFFTKLEGPVTLEFRMKHLDSPNKKIYFSQIQAEGEKKASPFARQSKYKEYWLQCSIGIFRSLKKWQNIVAWMFAMSGRLEKTPSQPMIEEAVLIKKINEPASLMWSLKKAEAVRRERILEDPSDVKEHRALARNLWLQGCFKHSLQQFHEAERRRIQAMENASLQHHEVVLLLANATQTIDYLDGLLKRKILSGDARPYHLVIEDGEIVNKAFLAYYEMHLHLQYPSVSGLDNNSISSMYSNDWNFALPQEKSEAIYVHAGLARVQRQWRREGRAPLCQLKPEHAARLEQFKASCGMKREDWFVCLHVNAGDILLENTHKAQVFRTIPIEDYYPAIQAVLEAGGWVVRMGDPSMQKLAMPLSINVHRVIDFAHHPERCDELDNALCAACHFLIATGSGLHTIAHAFGRPVCYVNVPLRNGFPHHPGDLFAPMFYYSIARHRLLSMQEILSSDLVYADHAHLLAAKGVALLRNTADEIAETVKEALQGERYQIAGHPQAEVARSSFERLSQRYGSDISGSVGLYYAAKYASRLFSDENTDAYYAGVEAVE